MAKPGTRSKRLPWLALVVLLLTVAVYYPGLWGGWLFDDYPNIVDNHQIQVTHFDWGSLFSAALSSPSSPLGRPLASISFALNYAISGMNPYSWKWVNLIIHLLNGWLVILLTRRLILASDCKGLKDGSARQTGSLHVPRITDANTVAILIGASWLLLPINLTGVLYVVQRMESMANLFVLIGLLGYVIGRQRMTAGKGGLLLTAGSLLLPTAMGLMAKETAVMLPLYACITEWIVFEFSGTGPVPTKAGAHSSSAPGNSARKRDPRIVGLFVLVLALPLVIGLGWLLPGLLRPGAWATRDFTMGTRLLSEARIIVDYIGWTLLPTPRALSFYHDDFRVSSGLLSPWTTLASILFLAAMTLATILLRKRRPLLALGLALFLGCHLLTGTILPLELIYEHRNYFASFGLLLAVVPLLVAPGPAMQAQISTGTASRMAEFDRPLPFGLLRPVLLASLMLLWTTQTALTAYSWGNPLRLAEELAARAPRSPRAQYELGRTYIIYSHYDPQSQFTRLAYAPLERAMELPESSILPEQALIFMNSRMGLPVKDAWWDSLIGKLKARTPGVQDESSLAALAECAQQGRCPLPEGRMLDAFLAALSHPNPGARLLATYAEYAWNVLGDRPLGLRMAAAAVHNAPGEPAYRITLVHMLVASDRPSEAVLQLQALQQLNTGGRLNSVLLELQRQVDAAAISDGVRP